MGTFRDKTVKGFFWGGVDTFLTKGLNFIFNLLIARQLMPADYGTIAILAVIMSICQCFVDSGFGAALIKKNNKTDKDFCTVFIFNIVIAFVFYALLFFLAPYIAKFYNIPLLTKVTRIYTLLLIINAISIIQHTKLTIAVNFKVFAKISTISVLISGAVTLWMASNGYGVWSLVVQGLLNSVIRTMMLCIIGKWIPKLSFSWTSFKEFFSFGSKLLGSSLINAVYNNLYTLVIGKTYSPSQLGHYNKGSSIAAFPSSSITTVLENVSYPILSSIQDDKELCLKTSRTIIRIVCYVSFPMMLGIASISDPFIRLFLTDKWEAAIPIVQILCLALLWNPLTSIDYAIQKITGHTDYFLKMTIYSKFIGILTLCLTIPLGIRAICWGQVISYLIIIPIYAYYTNKAIGYSFKMKLNDYSKSLSLSLIMSIFIYIIIHNIEEQLIKLVIGIITGFAFYIIMSFIFKIEELNKIMTTIKTYTKWRRK